jgi:chemotaxis family two-component system response regulator Rcp1
MGPESEASNVLKDILLVEDNPADVRLTREALREAGLKSRLHVARDGEDALDFLYQRGAHANAPRPDLILLDFNLPKKSGREVLVEIKGHDRLKLIPVIALTTSSAQEDIDLAYRQHANCFITKPMDLDQFINAIRVIGTFWLGVVTLPKPAA